MKPISLIASVFGVFLLGVSSSLAIPLNPNSVIFPTGTTANPANSGVVQNDNLALFRLDPIPATITDVGGLVQNRVVENPFGNLVFMPRIRDTFNIEGGTFVITSFRLTGFGGFDVDADFRTDGDGDKGFSSVSRSADGDQMTFRYDDPLFVDGVVPPGQQQESLFPALVTDATHYDFGGTMEILGYLAPLFASVLDPNASLISVTIDGIAAPTVAPVPLPASSLLLIGGIAGLMTLKRKRRA